MEELQERRLEAGNSPVVQSEADERAGNALGGRTDVMQGLAIRTVEVGVDDESALPRDEDTFQVSVEVGRAAVQQRLEDITPEPYRLR